MSLTRRIISRLALVLAQHAGELLDERLQVAGEHPVLVQAGQDLVHGHQGMQLAFVEPEPRQLVAAALERLRETVAVGVAVVDDGGGVHAVPQILQVALERGRRDLQVLQQVLERDAVLVADHQLDL